MKLLLHTCCAPCAIYPLEVLRDNGFEVMGFFYRHNIHPYTECLKRQATLETYAKKASLKVIYQDGYDLEGFLRKAAYRESERCRICYHDRLYATARIAKKGRFDYFSSSLLYSKFQNHQQIQSIAQAVAIAVGISFYYHDFREGWKAGIESSKDMGLYRQTYCGCIYSEKDRYMDRKKPQKE